MPRAHTHLHDQAIGDAVHARTPIAMQARAKHAQLRKLRDEVARELALPVCLRNTQQCPGGTGVQLGDAAQNRSYF